MLKGHTNNPNGKPPTWETPQQLLADFEAFLEEQKPHQVTEKINVKGKNGWGIEEVTKMTRQGLITITQFAAWKRVHRTTIITNYSEGVFQDTYQAMLSICEAYSERRLYEADRSAANIIFAMKNSYGWVDKSDLELSGHVSTPLSEEAKAYLDKASRADTPPGFDDDGAR
jgi:hypothetical protein